MREQLDAVRENTASLIIAECKKYIIELKKEWAKRITFIEERLETKSKPSINENMVTVSLVEDCPLSPSQKFCHSSCNWWNGKICIHPVKLKRKEVGESAAIK